MSSTIWDGPEGLTQALACADLNSPQGLDTFRATLAGRRAWLVYSDPPWDPGNEKYWRRHARLTPPAAGFDRLMDAWVACCLAADPEHVLVEMSIHADRNRWFFEAVARAGAAWRWPEQRRYEVRYSSQKLPNLLVHYGPRPLTTDPSGLHGQPMSHTAFAGLGLPRGSLVVDPCTGLGMTSRLAHIFGCHYAGTELNPTRLARTAAWVEKKGYRPRTGGAPLLPPPARPTPQEQLSLTVGDEDDAPPPLSAQDAAPVPVPVAPPADVGAVTAALVALAGLPVEERVAAYNAVQRALGALVADVTHGDPAASPQLLPAARVHANDYNPNRVASPELDLLEQSMRADGITMPIVVVPERGDWTVVDGFHRRTTAATRLGRAYLPASVITSSRADRMASTVRHNRARGKHQVDLMASLMRGMMAEGWDDERVAVALGMSVEESLRLRQMVGAARLLAGERYEREWAVTDDDANEGAAQ